MRDIEVFDKNIFTFIYFQSPFLVFISFIVLGIVTLLVCPKSIKTIKYKNLDVGFYSSYNWSIILPGFVPFALYVIIAFYQSIPTALDNLINAKVISSTNSIENVHRLITDGLCSYDFQWILSLFLISMVLNFYDFASYFFKKDGVSGETKVKDWTVAYQKWNTNGDKISKTKNLIFDFFMYFQQWFILFVCCVFTYKLIKIIFYFSGVFQNKNSDIMFKINYTDVYHQYGFWGLNAIIPLILVLFAILLSFFAIIRIVHKNRNVNWNFFPRIILYVFILAVVAGIFSFFGVIDNKLEAERNKEVVELLSHKEMFIRQFEGKEMTEIEFLKYNAEIKTLGNNIDSVLSQNILQKDNKLYYFFIALYILQVRIIVNPPKSLIDALRSILKE